MSTSTVTVRHNAEMGHRLPHLQGKCQSLHGHSWWFEVELTGQNGRLADDGTVVEFAAAKRALREFIDTRLDHGLALGTSDPLRELLAEHGKVFEVVDGWPTVETMARVVGERMQDWCRSHREDLLLYVVRCTATETHVNAATWTP